MMVENKNIKGLFDNGVLVRTRCESSCLRPAVRVRFLLKDGNCVSCVQYWQHWPPFPNKGFYLFFLLGTLPKLWFFLSLCFILIFLFFPLF